MGLLADKVAIITGAGGGIGRAHALAFAREGARVVVNDPGGSRDGSGSSKRMADEVVEEIEAAGFEAVANHDSVATREGVDSLVWTALNKLGRVDILVNNAGILRDRTLLNMTEAEWDAVLAVHLKGTFLTTQAVGRVMKRQGDGGTIVNTTSISGLKGMFGQGNYSAAKAGIAGLTYTSAMEFARSNIRVNAIAPIALTRMTEDLPNLGHERYGPEYISPAAVFLASSLSDGITGKILGVHGPHMFEYEVMTSVGIEQSDGQPWSPTQIRDRWGELVAKG